MSQPVLLKFVINCPHSPSLNKGFFRSRPDDMESIKQNLSKKIKNLDWNIHSIEEDPPPEGGFPKMTVLHITCHAEGEAPNEEFQEAVPPSPASVNDPPQLISSTPSASPAPSPPTPPSGRLPTSPLALPATRTISAPSGLSTPTELPLPTSDPSVSPLRQASPSPPPPPASEPSSPTTPGAVGALKRRLSRRSTVGAMKPPRRPESPTGGQSASAPGSPGSPGFRPLSPDEVNGSPSPPRAAPQPMRLSLAPHQMPSRKSFLSRLSHTPSHLSQTERRRDDGTPDEPMESPEPKIDFTHTGTDFTQWPVPPEVIMCPLVHTEQETRIEEQESSEPGLFLHCGEVRVLVVEKVTLQVTPRKREERHLAIVRDYTGAFILMVMIYRGRMIGKGKMKTEATYPITEGFQLERGAWETRSENVTYTINIDDMRFECEGKPEGRNRLARALLYAFGCMGCKQMPKAIQAAEGTTIPQHRPVPSRKQMLNRLCSTRFSAQTDPGPSGSILPLEKVVTGLVGMKRTVSPSQRAETLLLLRRYIKIHHQRAGVLERILIQLHGSPAPDTLLRLFELLEQFTKVPSLESRTEARNIISNIEPGTRLFESIPPSAPSSAVANALADNTQASSAAPQTLRDQVISLVETLRVVETVTKQFTDHKRIPDVPFDGVFYPGGQAPLYGQSDAPGAGAGVGAGAGKAKDKESKKRRKELERLERHGWANGTYIALFYFSDDGNLLLDNNQIIPSVQIQQGPCLLDEFSPEFEWALKYGMAGGTNPMAHKKESDLYSLPFQPAFRGGITALKKRLRPGAPFGHLFDRPLTFPATQATVFFIVRGFPTPDPGIVASSKYRWMPLLEHEQLVAQHYLNLPRTARLEQLPSTFYGARFFSALQQFSRAQSHPLTRGVYMGVMSLLSDLQGLHVLVPDAQRTCIPWTVIQQAPMTEAEWTWVQTFRLREERGMPYHDPDDHSDCFPNRFLRAMRELKDEMGLDSLGCLYDLEPILMDERDQVQLLVFVRQCVEKEIPNSMNQFLWRPLDRFETIHYPLYCPSRHAFYLGQLRDCDTTLESISEMGGNQLVRNDLIRRKERINRIFSPMRWPMTLYSWATRGLRSVTMCALQPEDTRKVEEVARDANAIYTNLSTKPLRALFVAGAEHNQMQKLDELERGLSRIEADMRARIRKDPNRVYEDEAAAFEPILGDLEEMRASSPPIDSVAIDFQLEDFLAPKDLDHPATELMCECLVNELVEDVLVRTVDKPELAAVESCVRDMVDLVECVEDLKQETMWNELRVATTKQLQEDRKAFAAQLNELFERPLPPINLVSLKPDLATMSPSTVVLEDRPTAYSNAIRSLALEFSSLVHATLHVADIVEGLGDVVKTVDMIHDLSIMADQKVRQAKRYCQRLKKERRERQREVLRSTTGSSVLSAPLSPPRESVVTEPTHAPHSPRSVGEAPTPTARASTTRPRRINYPLPWRSKSPTRAAMASPGSPEAVQISCSLSDILNPAPPSPSPLAREESAFPMEPAGPVVESSRVSLSTQPIPSTMQAHPPSMSRLRATPAAPVSLFRVVQRMADTKSRIRRQAKDYIHRLQSSRESSKSGRVPTRRTPQLTTSHRKYLAGIRELQTMYHHSAGQAEEEDFGYPSPELVAFPPEAPLPGQSAVPPAVPALQLHRVPQLGLEAPEGSADSPEGDTPPEPPAGTSAAPSNIVRVLCGSGGDPGDLRAELLLSASQAQFCQIWSGQPVLDFPNLSPSIAGVIASYLHALALVSSVLREDEAPQPPAALPPTPRDASGYRLVRSAILRPLSSPEGSGSSEIDIDPGLSVSELLDGANQLQVAPLLLLCAAGLAGVPTSLEARAHPQDDPSYLLQRLATSFLCDPALPAQTWVPLLENSARLVHIQAGPSTAGLLEAATEMIWYCRCFKDYAIRRPFEELRGCCKTLYAQNRIRSMILQGVDRIDLDEVELWSAHLGTAVRELDLRGAPNGALVVQFVASACPSLTHLNIAGLPGLTEEMLGELIEYCPDLTELDLTGCDLDPQTPLLRMLPETAPQLHIRWGN